MRYANDETAKKLVELEIKNREYAFSLYDEIIEVLAKFDGKQVTKRIETALRKIDDNIRVKNEYNSFIVEVGFWNIEKRSVKTENGIAYLKNAEETLCHCARFSSYGDGVLNEDNSLNYEAIKTQLVKHKEYMEKSTLEIKEQLADIETITSEYEELEKKCQEFNAKKNWCISEYYGLKRFSNN